MKPFESLSFKQHFKNYADKYYPNNTVRENFKLMRTYRSFIKDVFEGIQDYMIETGFSYKNCLGTFRIKKFNVQFIDLGHKVIKHNRNIDFKKSKELGKKVYYDNPTSKYNYGLVWEKSRFKRRSFYNFKTCIAFNKKLSQYILNNNELNFSE